MTFRSKTLAVFLLCIIVSACLTDCKNERQNTSSTDNISYTTVTTSLTYSEKIENVYIVNTNTGKFHRPGCPSVEQMSEHNKRKFVGSSDDLVSDGYEPCKRCEP